MPLKTCILLTVACLQSCHVFLPEWRRLLSVCSWTNGSYDLIEFLFRHLCLTCWIICLIFLRSRNSVCLTGNVFLLILGKFLFYLLSNSFQPPFVLLLPSRWTSLTRLFLCVIHRESFQQCRHFVCCQWRFLLGMLVLPRLFHTQFVQRQSVLFAFLMRQHPLQLTPGLFQRWFLLLLLLRPKDGCFWGGATHCWPAGRSKMWSAQTHKFVLAAFYNSLTQL